MGKFVNACYAHYTNSNPKLRKHRSLDWDFSNLFAPLTYQKNLAHSFSFFLLQGAKLDIVNFYFFVKAIRKFSGVGFLTANWSSHPSMTHVSFAWPAFLMTASLGWNSTTPESYLRMILPSLLDAHVFGACGWNLDGTRSDGCETSPGTAKTKKRYIHALIT